MEQRYHGPPGTGKTTTLARLITARAGVDPRILACSLTRTAAARLAHEDLPLDRDQVGTLHAHCYRALGRPELVERHLDEWNAEVPLSDRLSLPRRDLDEGGDAPGGKATRGDELRQRYDVLRGQMAPPDHWQWPTVRAWADRWEAWKTARGYLDFTDLIARAVDAPGNPTAIYVDEAQDHSPLELDLLRRWGRAAGALTLAGDADQSLYVWRGADPAVFLDPAVPHVDVPLTQSYRLPRAVHLRARMTIQPVRDRLAFDYAPRDADGIDRWVHDAGWRRPDFSIPRTVKEERAAGRELMVLAACGYMLAPTTAVLMKAGVPFHNPYRPTASAWNPLGSRATAAVLAFLRPRADVWGEDARAWTHADMAKWAAVLRPDQLHHPGAVTDLKARRGKDAQAPADPAAWLAEDALDALTPADSGSLWRAATLVDRPRLRYPLDVVAKSGPGALRARPGVIVGTVHSVKGGEADTVVFYPDLSPAGNRALWGRPAERDGVRRMTYVGVTRARERLYRTASAGRHHVDW